MERTSDDIREAESIDSERGEKVLIERDGKFELMNVSDMQAVEGAKITGGQGEIEDDPGMFQQRETDQEKQSQLRDQGSLLKSESVTETKVANGESDDQPEDSETTPKYSSDQPAAQESSHSSSISLGSQPDVSMTPTDKRSPTAEGEGASFHDETSMKQPPASCSELKSESQVQSVAIVDHIHGAKGSSRPKRVTPTKGLASVSMATLSQSSRSDRKRQLQMSRVQSAPGVRLKARGMDEENEKRERNEAAFAAWVARKNEEHIEKCKSEKANQKLNEEELKERRQRNEAAFKAWLAAKNREQKLQGKASTPVTNIPTLDEESRSAAFESWVSKKREQRRKEVELKKKRRMEEEEAAKKVEPGIVEQAYKE